MEPVTLPRPVQAVVFDMDGVLVDSEGLFRDAMMEVSREQGRDLPDAVFMRMVGAPRDQNRRVILEHFGADFDFETWVAAANARAFARMALGLDLKPGALELMGDLEAAGLPMAVATSAGRSAVERELGPAGLIPRFQAIVTRDDCERGKPHPDPFLIAAERLGLAPQDCLALEDSHNGVRSAAAAGMMTIMIPDLLDPTDEVRALCLAVLPSLNEVRRLPFARPVAP
jgi:HAD superfamily hydrolase (TIGR01509 family)